MAERRMISKSIVDSDAFLDMPQSTQNLYFHLNIRADDDGFINNPKKIMRSIGANQNDLEILIAKRYVLIFESGVIVIKHWKLHNCIRKDRYKPTLYQEELQTITEKENGAYTTVKKVMVAECQPTDNQMEADGTLSIGKVSKGEDSIDPASPLPPAVNNPKPLSKMKDGLATHYQDLFTDIYPYTGWGDISQERQQLNTLAKKTRALFNTGVPYADANQTAEAIFKKFLAMKQSGFWKAKDKPVTPSSLSSCWAEVIDGLIKDHAKSQPFEEVEIF